MRALSIFSGIGLHDLGLERAGWEIAGQVENDPWCSAVLARHWPGVPRWEDVRNVTAESIRERAGVIDLITGGFPCTDISLAGKGAGLSGEQSGLWREMLRLIRGVAPAWCFVENVPALRLRGAQQVVSDLEESGYTVLPPVVVGAWAAGAPHRRDRVWIVARLANPNSDGLGWRTTAAGWPQRSASAGHDGAESNHSGVAYSDSGRRGPSEQPLRGRQLNAPRSGGSIRAGMGDSPGERGGEQDDTRHALADDGRPAHQEGSVSGCPGGRGMGNPADLGRGEGKGRAPEPGEPATGRPLSRGAVRAGVAHAGRNGIRQLEQREPAGWEARGLRDGGETEPGGMRQGGVADANGARLAEHGGEPGDAREERAAAVGGRWPAGRGEPQHSWEPSRLTQPRMGGVADGRASRLDSFARRNRLRALGNANPPDIPELIGRWILAQEAAP